MYLDSVQYSMCIILVVHETHIKEDTNIKLDVFECIWAVLQSGCHFIFQFYVTYKVHNNHNHFNVCVLQNSKIVAHPFKFQKNYMFLC